MTGIDCQRLPLVPAATFGVLPRGSRQPDISHADREWTRFLACAIPSGITAMQWDDAVRDLGHQGKGAA